ncbi:hypothetical protein RF641_14430, partial [Arthrobacter sp. LS16]|uniref:hypothetical protein n=1 Tax=Arthrobacter sp. 'calajunan' TaxID=1690248 RepID=UPI003C77B253
YVYKRQPLSFERKIAASNPGRFTLLILRVFTFRVPFMTSFQLPSTKDPDRVRRNAVRRLQELGFDVELIAREGA